MNKPCYNDFFSIFLSPRGQILFSTALNFMEEHSDFDVLLLLKDYNHQWTDPTKGQDPSSQNGRTQPGSQTYTNPQNGRTPPRVKTPVHKVDGPHQGHKLIQIHKVDGPHQGSRLQSTKWTDPTRVTNLYKFAKWTNPTKGQDHSSRSGRTR